MGRDTLYISDLDGTLLRPDGTLGPFTRDVVNSFISDGGLFTYATARSFYRAQQAVGGLNLQVPVITYSGALVIDPQTGAGRRSATVAIDSVTALLQQAPVHGLQPLLFVLHEGRDRLCWINEVLTPGVKDFLGQRDGDPRLLPLTSWRQLDLSGVFYVSIIGALDQLRAFQLTLADGLADCAQVLSEDIYRPGQYAFDITSARATKSAALEVVVELTGASRVVCFGDNLNDLPLFRAADESYAVGNALPEVKQLASGVIGDNSTDGVARWLSANAVSTP